MRRRLIILEKVLIGLYNYLDIIIYLFSLTYIRFYDGVIVYALREASPELCFSVYGISRLMLRRSVTMPFCIRTVPFVFVYMIMYGPLVGLFNLACNLVLVTRTLFPTTKS